MTSPAPSRGGSLAYLAVATKVLERSGPMTFDALYRAVSSNPGFSSRGKTPRNSLYSLIWRHSRAPKPDFRLFRGADGQVMVELTAARTTPTTSARPR